MKSIPYGAMRVTLSLDVISVANENEDQAVAQFDSVYYLDDDKNSVADIIEAFEAARDVLSGNLEA